MSSVGSLPAEPGHRQYAPLIQPYGLNLNRTIEDVVPGAENNRIEQVLRRHQSQ